VTGAVVVTTPQDMALMDGQKGIEMFGKVDIPVLGIVENMSTHICSNCGHHEPLFGSGGGERLAQDYGVQLLGQMPCTRPSGSRPTRERRRWWPSRFGSGSVVCGYGASAGAILSRRERDTSASIGAVST